jgi:DNA-binding NarL/FixJ family response regulator
VTIRTVVVDDEEDVRELVRTRLEHEGRFEVVAVGADAAAAKALVAEHQPHLLILDDMLPDGPGTDAVPAIRASAPNTAVIIYTAHTGTAVRDAAAVAGAHAVVGKIDDFSMLLRVIDRLLGLGQPAATQTEGEAAFAARMHALLEQPEPKRGLRAWWSSAGTRKGLIVVLLLALPVIVFVVWLIAFLAGFVSH